MFDVAIYTKTAQGRTEVSERRLGLSPRLRQVLILVDGKTPYGELKPLLAKLGEPAELVGQLTTLGLILSDYDLPPMPEFPRTESDAPLPSDETQPNK
jgi:hypothetical protein